MQTRALKTLVEIETVGSFAAAAARLNMTLSAVSMQMKALEADLDAALFDRAFRPPRLTPLGRTICEEARALLAAEARLRAACAPADRLAGHYRIGFVPTASVRLLPTFLLNAQTKAPAAHFHVVTGLTEALERQVKAGTLDLAVLTGSPGGSSSGHPTNHSINHSTGSSSGSSGSSSGDPALAYRPLCEEALAFAAPPAPAVEAPDVLIAHLPFLHFMPSSGIGKLIADHMEPVAASGRGTMVLDRVEAIMECVNRGIGFTLLPEPDIARYAAPATRVFPAGPRHFSRTLALSCARASRHHAQLGAIAALFADPAAPPTPSPTGHTPKPRRLAPPPNTAPRP